MEKFYSYLEELLASYTKLSALLQEKILAAEASDMDRLEELLREEQVYVLVSRGFEGTIQNHKASLSVTGDTLGEIIEELPQGERARFRDVFVQLQGVLGECKLLNEKCQEMIESKLYTLNRTIQEMEKSAGGGYGKPGESDGKDNPPRLFTKSV